MMATTAPPGFSGLAFANRQESRYERPAIRGIACRYNVPFQYEGKLTAFVAGCFTDSLNSGRTVDLRLEHDEQIVLANAGIRFVDTADFLAFEYEPQHDQSGAVITGLVASGSRTDVSVGARLAKTTTRNMQGHGVRLVTSANLVEISLCESGAVPTAHARVVDLDDALTLEAEAQAGVLGITGRGNELVTCAKSLRAKLDLIEDGYSPPGVEADSVADHRRGILCYY